MIYFLLSFIKYSKIILQLFIEAISVINRVEARAQKGKYDTERFLFNSA